MPKKNILYFGYGANRDGDMMEAIIGRKPDGYPAILENYELCVQVWEEIPEKVRKIISGYWGLDFRTYCIRQAKGKAVYGMVWFITKKERELVGNWELERFWYEPVTVEVTGKDGIEKSVQSQAINSLKIKRAVDGEHYPIFLNNKKKMFAAAKSERDGYLV